MAAPRFKIDILSIALAVVALLAVIAGAVLVSGHAKRGLLAFGIAVVAAAGAVYAARRAAQTPRHRDHRR